MPHFFTDKIKKMQAYIPQNDYFCILNKKGFS